MQYILNVYQETEKDSVTPCTLTVALLQAFMKGLCFLFLKQDVNEGSVLACNYV